MTGPPPKDWQELGDEFYMAMGQCIAAWAEVEDELFRIFRDCLGPYEQSAIIYYRTPGFEVRLGLTDEIVRSVLPKRPKQSGAHDHPSLKAWIAAKSDYQKLLAFRSRVAHHPVRLREGNLYDVKDLYAVQDLYNAAPSWFEIYVSEHESLRDRSSELPAINIEDMKDHLKLVVLFRDRLRHFFFDVLQKRHEEPPKPNPPQSPD